MIFPARPILVERGIGRLAAGVATDRLTATWQLSVLPSCPQYWRATPTECVPCLGIPVSSAIQNTGPPSGSFIRGNTQLFTRACTASSCQGDWATKWFND